MQCRSRRVLQGIASVNSWVAGSEANADIARKEKGGGIASLPPDRASTFFARYIRPGASSLLDAVVMPAIGSQERSGAVVAPIRPEVRALRMIEAVAAQERSCFVITAIGTQEPTLGMVMAVVAEKVAAGMVLAVDADELTALVILPVDADEGTRRMILSVDPDKVPLGMALSVDTEKLRHTAPRSLLAGLAFGIVDGAELRFVGCGCARAAGRHRARAAACRDRAQLAALAGGFLRRGRRQRAQVVRRLQATQPCELVGLVQLLAGGARHVDVERRRLVDPLLPG